jgi:hypothetical protein
MADLKYYRGKHGRRGCKGIERLNDVGRTLDLMDGKLMEYCPTQIVIGTVSFTAQVV